MKLTRLNKIQADQLVGIEVSQSCPY